MWYTKGQRRCGAKTEWSALRNYVLAFMTKPIPTPMISVVLKTRQGIPPTMIRAVLGTQDEML